VIVHREFAQQSVEWMLARAGIPTASEFGALVSPTGEVRVGKGVETYLAQKLAEKWRGGPITEFSSFDMDQGSILEKEALPAFRLLYEVNVETVGFIHSNDRLLGCSPDGWIETEKRGIEIKCPADHNHVKYLLADKLPPDYIAQVQGSMHVAECESWYFMSHCRGLPPLILLIQRDEEYQEALAQALDEFHQMMDIGWEKLIHKNGGPPARSNYVHTPKPAAEKFVSELPT